MKIYFFRHAEKASAIHSDPDLSVRGFSQAKKLTSLVKSKKLLKPDLIISSPKIRAINSFKDLSISCEIKLVTDKMLLERQSGETQDKFLGRIKNFINQVASKNVNIYVCSHYDWLIESMSLLPCDSDLSGAEFHHWTPLQYVAFEINDSLYKFIEIGQIIA